MLDWGGMLLTDAAFVHPQHKWPGLPDSKSSGASHVL